jgi:hypothetical protein
MFKNTVKYNWKTMLPKLMLAGLAIGGSYSCKPKPGDEPEIKKHTTTYVFGPDKELSISAIAASADSASVEKIVIKSDGASWNGTDLSEINSDVLMPAFSAAGNKAQAAGTLNNVLFANTSDKQYAESLGYGVVALPQHTTKYVFGYGYWDVTDEQIQASADSVEVKEIVLQARNQSMNGMGSTVLRNNFLDSKFAISDKVKGAGDLSDLGIQSEADSLALVAMGYKVNAR